MKDFSNEEIAFRVIKPFVGDTIREDDLYQIVRETVNFRIPLVQVNEQIFSLELFHGPTLAFKDVGARFMSRCLGYFLKTEKDIKCSRRYCTGSYFGRHRRRRGKWIL